MTRSHEMSLNLKFWQFEITIYTCANVSNLQFLLVILALKSRFYSKQCGRDVIWKVACVAEAILGKSALKLSQSIE